MHSRNFRYLLLLMMFSVIPLKSHAQPPREELMARIHETESRIHEIENEQRGLEERLREIERMDQRQDVEKRIEDLESEKRGLRERLESLQERLAHVEEPGSRPEQEPRPEPGPEPPDRKSFVDLFKEPTVLAATITAIAVIVAALIALLRRR
jgi:septal ring factor EnvC (AmiA/AmiB activator)